MIDYEWYEIVSAAEPITQGDFIRDCPIVIPPSDISESDEGAVYDSCVEYYDVIIISQACDIENNKLKYIIVCPLWDLEAFVGKYTNFNNPGGKENLRKGLVFHYHMLNKSKSEDFAMDYKIVDFKKPFNVDIELIRDLAKKAPRLRLLPPYREQLSQMFARSFMRVGLPKDIPKFK